MTLLTLLLAFVLLRTFVVLRRARRVDHEPRLVIVIEQARQRPARNRVVARLILAARDRPARNRIVARLLMVLAGLVLLAHAC
jgi:hypothetical protein